jgi:hypothetical protein
VAKQKNKEEEKGGGRLTQWLIMALMVFLPNKVVVH